MIPILDSHDVVTVYRREQQHGDGEEKPDFNAETRIDAAGFPAHTHRTAIK